MEAFMGQTVYNPHLKKVLKTYQLSAPKSLQGPSSVLTVVAKKEPATEPSPEPFTTPPPLPIQQLPILTAPDRSPSQRCETNLHGESITCFLVGGEKRLCLPQLLHSILRDFTYAQINAVCDTLQIFCSRCNQEQLEELKETGVLPKSAPSCGLITKTDAERLCSALLHRPVAAPRSLMKTTLGITVYHECFGKCKGVLFPELYADSESPCVECLECRCLFSPRQYVCHSHHPPENRTCHWGFDSDNWRVYMLLHRDQPDLEEREKLLETVKNSHVKSNNIKQMLESMGAKVDWSRERERDWEKERERERERERKEEEEEVVVKKMKLDDGAYEVPPPPPPAAFLQPYDAAAFQYCWYDPYMRSAFRPWHHALAHIDEKAFAESVPAYLSHDPPVLLHPERVVPMSESERFERTFQPNVALAPRTDHRRNEVKTESVIREEKKPIPKDRKPYNPEIELSTDTDDSTSDQNETGTAVEQVATVFAALSDAKETTRELVVSLVERLAGRLESLEAENRRLRKDNLALQQQISKEQAKLRERLCNTSEADGKNESEEEMTSPLENPSRERDRDREHRLNGPKSVEHGKKQGKIVERDKLEETETTNRVSPISPVPSSSEVKPDLVAPHISVVRSSPVSVITSQASIKMEPLSE